MTLGRGSFGRLNLWLLLAAAGAAGLFAVVESHSPSPLLRPAMLRRPALRASLAAGALVSTVIMATMVVGPFYLARALGLDAARVGLLLSVGPLVAALTAVPAGRIADRIGAARMTLAGLGAMAAGAAALALLPAALGVPGYLAPIVVLTAGYAFFQTANNTVVLADAPPDERGTLSGLLHLSRNLGLITGASAMGAIFTFASATRDLATAPPASVATGMRITYGGAAALIAAALVVTARPAGETSPPPVPDLPAERRRVRPLSAPDPVFLPGADRSASRSATPTLDRRTT
jgi:MFS family permease